MGIVAWFAVMCLWAWPGVAFARRKWWIGCGVSEELGSHGELKVWKFKSAWLSVTADFATETVRIRTKEAKWHDARNGGLGKISNSAVNITQPMSGLTHSISEHQETRLGMTRTTGMGIAPGNVAGQSIMVSVPVTVNVHNGQTYQSSTGNHILNFAWDDVSKRVKKPTNPTGLVGPQWEPRIDREKTDHHVDISVTLRSSVISKFEDPWSKVVERMKALDQAHEKALLAKA